MRPELEGIASEILEETGCVEPPVDAFELAECCGLEVRYGSPGRVCGQEIVIAKRARNVRQHGTIAHELAHWALGRGGEPDSEDSARYLAGALMLPREGYERDLTATKWDLRKLQAKHLNVSAEMAARRLVQLRDAVAAIWDQGKLKARVASSWLPEGYSRVSLFERELAATCLETGEVQRPDDLIWAFPVFSGVWRRVVVVAEAEQLSLRF